MNRTLLPPLWFILTILFAPLLFAAATDKPLTNWTRDDLLEAKKQWQRQGFRMDLSQFALSNATPAQLYAGFIITNAGSNIRLRGPLPMQAIGPRESLVGLSQSNLNTDEYGNDLWIQLDQILRSNDLLLREARSAAFQTPLRFDSHHTRGLFRLPHLAPVQNCAAAFSLAALADLRHSRMPEAATNLLALTSLIASWEIAPFQVSHLVRATMFRTTLYRTFWEALACTNWTDETLLQFQEALHRLDLFSSLPDAIALESVLAIERMSAARDQAQGQFSISDNLKQAASQPRAAFAILKNGFEYREYLRDWLNHWSYVEEASLLQYFIDQEKAIRAALEKTNWLQMRPLWLPAWTNDLPEHPKFHLVADYLRVQRATLASSAGTGGVLGNIVNTEAHRRILLTALAVERYRLKKGSPPAALSELMPEFVPATPIDPIDGQPLRYSKEPDGQYLIYSIGLDAEDNSGTQLFRLPASEPNRSHDLLWPKRIPSTSLPPQ